MAIDNVEAYLGDEEDLIFRNQEAVLNLVMPVFYDDDAETPYDFPGYVSGFFQITDERLGTQLKFFTSQVTRNSNILVFNLSVADMTFQDNGKYYYQIGYIMTGGYTRNLRFGNLKIR